MKISAKHAIIFFSWIILMAMLSAAPAAESVLNEVGGQRIEKQLTGLNSQISNSAEKTTGWKKENGKEKVSGPEIMISGDDIYLNSKKMKLGESLKNWKSKIPGQARCFTDDPVLCLWDDLGLEVMTDDASDQKVIFFVVHLNLSEEEKNYTAGNYPRDKNREIIPDYLPHKKFPGSLRVDGFEIDAETKFWQVRGKVDPRRVLECGLLDCSHPKGLFGEHGRIYLHLDGRNERSKLLRFGVESQ